jgi:hypothetical protein
MTTSALASTTHQTFTETSPSGNPGLVVRSICFGRMEAEENDVQEDANDGFKGSWII